MSYGGYQQGGYGQPNPYAQQDVPNPYAQPAQTGSYGGGGYEMQNMNDGGYQEPAAADPNRILNDCRDIDRSLDQIEQELQGLQSIQYTILNGSGDPRDNRAGQARLNQANDNIIASYQGLVQRMKKIKGLPDSASPRNAPQVGRVDRRLKATIQKYQTLERDFRRDLQESIARQVRIVKPDATDEEVRQAAEDPNQQVFAQALQTSNRRGQAQSTLNNVAARHEAIQKIERDMMTLAQLFQDLETAVIEQAPLVETIEQKGEEVHDNVQKANVEIDGAITKARARNKKKWICLGICVAIVVIIIVVVLVYLKANNMI